MMLPITEKRFSVNKVQICYMTVSLMY